MKVHLIGVCGTGMGSLAGLLKRAGHEVHGSDEHVYPPMSTQLAELGIPVADGFRPENLDWRPDRVVVGNVCRRDHVEVVAAQERGLALTSFPALLSELFLAERRSCVVAGTHGKTTSSSLLAHVLAAAGRDPSFLIGGVPLDFGRGWRLGAGPHFVVEGDEYDTAFFDKGPKFLHYRPKTAILTSVELDHVDIYADLAAVEEAFARFVALLPDAADGGLLAVAASSPRALAVAAKARARVETYGRPDAAGALWRAANVERTPGGRTAFDVRRGDAPFGRFEIGLAGDHNLENAVGVVAAAAGLGLSAGEIATGLATFAGVRRRQEVRGIAQGVTVIDDFAHHPTAVRETLAALRGRHGPGKLIALYEPRSATSRRATFQKELADAFAAADEVVVAPLHDPQRIPAEARFDPERMAADLRGKGVPARHVTTVDAIVAHVAERAKPGDTVVVMSSGAFGGVHQKLLARLGDAVTPTEPEDAPRIRGLLDRVGLAHPGLAERIGDFLVIRGGPEGHGGEGAVVGCVAMETYGQDGILRSLAVLPERRGEGLGWLLADSVIRLGVQRGVRRIYLLTERASDFFAAKLGFAAVPRESMPAAVRASGELALKSNADATCMLLDLAARGK